MSLKTWAENGWLQALTFERDEILKILDAVDRDLATARVPDLHPDWKFNIAYNAVIGAAAAALAAEGYRAAREQHHHRVLESLRLTLEIDAALSRKLDICRKKRNVGVYQQVGTISEEEAQEMIETAENVRARTIAWLKTRHGRLGL